MSIDYAELEETLSDALEQFTSKVLEREPPPSLYALGLYAGPEFVYLVPTANVLSSDGAWLTARPGVPGKWSPLDWKYHVAFPETFKRVEALMLAGCDADHSSFSVDEPRLEALLLRVLSDLQVGRFQGSNTTIGIFMGGTGNPLVERSIADLNPPHLAQNFRFDQTVF